MSTLPKFHENQILLRSVYKFLLNVSVKIEKNLVFPPHSFNVIHRLSQMYALGTWCLAIQVRIHTYYIRLRRKLENSYEKTRFKSPTSATGLLKTICGYQRQIKTAFQCSKEI